jgi:hypothetical protein
MRPSLAAVTLSLIAGCQGSSDPPAPILSLVPTAMRAVGPSAPADESTLCLIAGASVEATIYVHHPRVTIIVVAFTPTPQTAPDFVLQLGSRTVASNTVRTVQAEASLYRTEAERGEQVVRLQVPGKSPGVFCLRQVLVTQP